MGGVVWYGKLLAPKQWLNIVDTLLFFIVAVLVIYIVVLFMYCGIYCDLIYVLWLNIVVIYRGYLLWLNIIELIENLNER